MVLPSIGARPKVLNARYGDSAQSPPPSREKPYEFARTNESVTESPSIAKFFTHLYQLFTYFGEPEPLQFRDEETMS